MDDLKPTHSPIGASSMSRWSACPASISLSKGIESPPGTAAMEGTAAHELVGLALERALSENVPTLTILQKTIEAVNKYAEYVESLIKGVNPYHIEHSFDMSAIYPNLYGTADAVVYDKESKTLHVIDYKHGEGLVVEVENNLQLQYYALGALTTLNYPCSYVTMSIVQPRAYHPAGHIRSWTVPALHFLEFEETLVKAAKRTEEKNPELKAGPHCMFCPAKPFCKERANANTLEAKKEFTFYKDPKDDFDVYEEPVSGDLDLFS